MTKVKITRGVLYNRKPLEAGTVIDLQDGIAAAFISQHQAVLHEASPDKGDVDASKSEDGEVEAPKTAKPKKAKKKK